MAALPPHRLRGRFLAGLDGFLATPRAAAATPLLTSGGGSETAWLRAGRGRQAASAGRAFMRQAAPFLA